MRLMYSTNCYGEEVGHKGKPTKGLEFTPTQQRRARSHPNGPQGHQLKILG